MWYYSTKKKTEVYRMSNAKEVAKMWLSLRDDLAHRNDKSEFVTMSKKIASLQRKFDYKQWTEFVECISDDEPYDPNIEIGEVLLK